ncbi:Uncharacterised protein [Enterobacter cancerogenus]|uniref:Uncharacterized protein n=1 Tax=Enterobacter cancerogenus TaxID=69218 RepID=A0A484YWP5_9ENTR|nr:Uncharacterised protein [Enterobacter cancerogenus]
MIHQLTPRAYCSLFNTACPANTFQPRLRYVYWVCACEILSGNFGILAGLDTFKLWMTDIVPCCHNPSAQKYTHGPTWFNASA